MAERGTQPLPWWRLRQLTIDARTHPRGQPHLGAASGLVCTRGRAYVIADDEHHLAVFDSATRPGALHRLAAGDLPAGKEARKARKPDLETLLHLPPGWREGGRSGSGEALLALSSGATARRRRGWLVPLDASGEPQPACAFDLAPLFDPLAARLGEINIEGAFVAGDTFVLLHRGGDGRRGRNALAVYPLTTLHTLLEGRAGRALPPRALRTCRLGAHAGVGLGFTDGAALPRAAGGGFLFTAVAEASADSIADGECVGAVLGQMSLDGALAWMRPLPRAPKVEGLALRCRRGGVDLCLVTDADDPARPSALLRARL